MNNQLIACLQQYKIVPIEDAEIISGYFKSKIVKEGDYLFEGNKVCREMFFVCKGVIRIGSVNEKGNDLTHVFYAEDNFCTVLQSFNDEISTSVFIQASCNVEALFITKTQLMELFDRFPYVKEIIDHINQLGLIEKVNVRNAFLGQEAEDKYKMFVNKSPGIINRVPLKDVASYLGITPQSLSRIRKQISKIS